MEFRGSQFLIHILNTNVGLIPSCQDLFRVRVLGTDRIRYLVFNHNPWEKAGQHFGEDSLTSLPPGDHWNRGSLARDVHGRFSIESVFWRDLPSVPL